MYTYGYIKEVVLAKMDMTSDEVIRNRFMNKVPFYANEAITQICSSIKAKSTYAVFNATTSKEYFASLRSRFNITDTDFDFSFMWKTRECNVEDLPIAPVNMQTMWHEFHDNNVVFVNETVYMPNDFVNWGDDINRVERVDLPCHDLRLEVATDEDWNTIGWNQCIFFKPGRYMLSYMARWFTFTPNMSDDVELDIPADIVDALPSYIVSQLYKVDDEAKANSYRVEFETFCARIEENRARTNKTFHIRGGW